jgi:hypothetical protein
MSKADHTSHTLTLINPANGVTVIRSYVAHQKSQGDWYYSGTRTILSSGTYTFSCAYAELIFYDLSVSCKYISSSSITFIRNVLASLRKLNPAYIQQCDYGCELDLGADGTVEFTSNSSTSTLQIKIPADKTKFIKGITLNYPQSENTYAPVIKGEDNYFNVALYKDNIGTLDNPNYTFYGYIGYQLGNGFLGFGGYPAQSFTTSGNTLIDLNKNSEKNSSHIVDKKVFYMYDQPQGDGTFVLDKLTTYYPSGYSYISLISVNNLFLKCGNSVAITYAQKPSPAGSSIPMDVGGTLSLSNGWHVEVSDLHHSGDLGTGIYIDVYDENDNLLITSSYLYNRDYEVQQSGFGWQGDDNVWSDASDIEELRIFVFPDDFDIYNLEPDYSESDASNLCSYSFTLRNESNEWVVYE